MLNKAQRRERARIAAFARHHKDDPAAVDPRRTEFKTRRLEEHIRSVVDGDPPLTRDQLLRVAMLVLMKADPLSAGIAGRALGLITDKGLDISPGDMPMPPVT